MVKKIEDMFIHFDRIRERDRQTDGRLESRSNDPATCIQSVMYAL